MKRFNFDIKALRPDFLAGFTLGVESITLFQRGIMGVGIKDGDTLT